MSCNVADTNSDYDSLKKIIDYYYARERAVIVLNPDTPFHIQDRDTPTVAY